MKTIQFIGIACALLIITACQQDSMQEQSPTVCSDAWYRTVEASIGSGDGMGHGPDIGSVEWKSVVEFRLGVRGNPDVPDRNSPQWCEYIQGVIQKR